MADEQKPTTEDEGTEEKPKKKGLMLVGGIVGVLALAFIASTMAVPAKKEPRKLLGPLTGPLTEENISVNLSDNQSKRYLQFKLHCEFYAYETDYYGSRLLDPLYMPRLLDALQRVASSLTVEDVTGKVNRPIVVQEMIQGIDPVLFPIHIGETSMPYDMEKSSGLRPGYSNSRATFKGYLDEHTLKVDVPAKTLQVNDGPVVQFEGTETDLEVTTVDGKTLYFDVTGCVPDFQGELVIGCHGHLQNLLIQDWILQ